LKTRVLSSAAVLETHAVFTLLFVALLTPSGAFAAEILRVERWLQVSTFADSRGLMTDSSNEQAGSAAIGLFSEEVVDGVGLGDLVTATGEVMQHSTVSAVDGVMRVEGSGSAGGGVSVMDPGFASRGRVDVRNLLVVDFEVSQASPFTLNISMLADAVETSRGTGLSRVTNSPRVIAWLANSSSGLLFQWRIYDHTPGNGAARLDDVVSGLLGVDTYTLSIFTGGDFQGREEAEALGLASFDVRLLVVPEPSTALLLGLGLVGLRLASVGASD